jgi:hypothetical protein
MHVGDRYENSWRRKGRLAPKAEKKSRWTRARTVGVTKYFVQVPQRELLELFEHRSANFFAMRASQAVVTSAVSRAATNFRHDKAPKNPHSVKQEVVARDAASRRTCWRRPPAAALYRGFWKLVGKRDPRVL